MAELASSMSSFLLPNNFQALDQDSESDSESSIYDSKLPFSSPSPIFSNDSSPNVDVESYSPNVKVEYLPQASDYSSRTSSTFNSNSMNLSIDSGYTPNSSSLSTDLSASGRFSSVDTSLCSDTSVPISLGSETSRTCHRSIRNSYESSDESTIQPVTPTKPSEDGPILDPLTPTANLKMLLSAMSPEIRNMEKNKKKARLFDAMVEVATQGQVISNGTTNSPNRAFNYKRVTTGGNINTLNGSMDHETSLGSSLNSPQDENGGEDGEKSNRKSKSLGLLCQKFLTKYPDYPEDGKAMEISLDQISKDLNVERRRIYDIVNVLESVEMVSRRAKNRYLWHGRTHINGTLAKLKCLGERQKFGEQLNQLQNRLLDDGMLSADENMFRSPVYGADRLLAMEVAKRPLHDLTNFSSPLNSPTEMEMRKEFQREIWEDDTKRDKTLGVMSQKFIMLFLVCKDRVISLDVAARILKGDHNYQIGESAKFKTKVRRLYDIANILTSLNLIDKIHLSEGRGRKPAFRWIGPDPDTTNVDMSELPSGTRPTQKHSYFALPPVTADSWTSNPTHKQAAASVKIPLQKPAVSAGKPRVNWSRNASFSAICEVAEQECRKYSSSAPNSPVKSPVNVPEVKQEKEPSPPPASGRPVAPKKEAEFIQEFEALRNKYPACVSRLFSTLGPQDSAPATPDLPPPSAANQLQSPTDMGVSRLTPVTPVDVQSPRVRGVGGGEGGISPAVGKQQKVVYVQRFVPLLNANTMAAVQASTSPQSSSHRSKPTVVTSSAAGNRTPVRPPCTGAPQPLVMPPAPGSMMHLLPVRHENWVQLPRTSGSVQRCINLSQTGPAAKPGESNGVATSSTSPQIGNTSPMVTIVRRSKRAVKLTLDKEFEYQPVMKKIKPDEMTTPAQNPTVVVARQPLSDPLPRVAAPLPRDIPLALDRPLPKEAPMQGNASVEKACKDDKKDGKKGSLYRASAHSKDTPQVKHDARQRQVSLRHVKRRLSIDLDNAPPDPHASPLLPPPRKGSRNFGKKMLPRCHSFPVGGFEKKSKSLPRRVLSPDDRSKGLGSEKTLSHLCQFASQCFHKEFDEKAPSVAQEHNYSCPSVSMTFGGKFGSLETSDGHLDEKKQGPEKDEDLKDVDDVADKKESAGVAPEKNDHKVMSRSLEDARDQVPDKDTDGRSSVKTAEPKMLEIAANAELEDCWLSSSFPPPSLSLFPRILQGRGSRGTPFGSSSRSSSTGSIGELDKWLFPGENASPSVLSGQDIKKVTTPIELSAEDASAPAASTCASPPRITTQATPATDGLPIHSPQPVTPQRSVVHHDSPLTHVHGSAKPPFHQSIHGFFESPLAPRSNTKSQLILEPLLTSTPKGPHLEAQGSGKTNASSDLSERSYPIDYSDQSYTTASPQRNSAGHVHTCPDDLGKIKPLDGIPVSEESKSFIDSDALQTTLTYPTDEDEDQETSGTSFESHSSTSLPPTNQLILPQNSPSAVLPLYTDSLPSDSTTLPHPRYTKSMYCEKGMLNSLLPTTQTETHLHSDVDGLQLPPVESREKDTLRVYPETNLSPEKMPSPSQTQIRIPHPLGKIPLPSLGQCHSPQFPIQECSTTVQRRLDGMKTYHTVQQAWKPLSSNRFSQSKVTYTVSKKDCIVHTRAHGGIDKQPWTANVQDHKPGHLHSGLSPMRDGHLPMDNSPVTMNHQRHLVPEPMAVTHSRVVQVPTALADPSMNYPITDTTDFIHHPNPSTSEAYQESRPEGNPQSHPLNNPWSVTTGNNELCSPNARNYPANNSSPAPAYSRQLYGQLGQAAVTTVQGITTCYPLNNPSTDTTCNKQLYGPDRFAAMEGITRNYPMNNLSSATAYKQLCGQWGQNVVATMPGRDAHPNPMNIASVSTTGNMRVYVPDEVPAVQGNTYNCHMNNPPLPSNYNKQLYGPDSLRTMQDSTHCPPMSNPLPPTNGNNQEFGSDSVTTLQSNTRHLPVHNPPPHATGNKQLYGQEASVNLKDNFICNTMNNPSMATAPDTIQDGAPQSGTNVIARTQDNPTNKPKRVVHVMKLGSYKMQYRTPRIISVYRTVDPSLVNSFMASSVPQARQIAPVNRHAFLPIKPITSAPQ